MLISTQGYEYNTRLISPIVTHIKSKSNSSFENSDKKNQSNILYNKKNKRLSTKDKLEELNQILYSPSLLNTIILKSKFETMA
jgi:hypothetical protein